MAQVVTTGDKLMGEVRRARMTPDTVFFNLGQELRVERGTYIYG